MRSRKAVTKMLPMLGILIMIIVMFVAIYMAFQGKIEERGDFIARNMVLEIGASAASPEEFDSKYWFPIGSYYLQYIFHRGDSQDIELYRMWLGYQDGRDKPSNYFAIRWLFGAPGDYQIITTIGNPIIYGWTVDETSPRINDVDCWNGGVRFDSEYIDKTPNNIDDDDCDDLEYDWFNTEGTTYIKVLDGGVVEVR